jgi:hypothetical protein
MEIFDNANKTVINDLRVQISKGEKLSIAAACFSIYAYRALKKQLEGIEELRFIFTHPTYLTEDTANEKREFYIPRISRERSLYGTDFEVKLRNELTQKAISRECAAWIRKKARFRSILSDGMIDSLIDILNKEYGHTYTPISSFTTTDLGCRMKSSTSRKCNRAYRSWIWVWKKTPSTACLQQAAQPRWRIASTAWTILS